MLLLKFSVILTVISVISVLTEIYAKITINTRTQDMLADTLKVLIIGGYGTFGGWVARLLAQEPRLSLLIAGRSLHKAQAFIAEYKGRAGMIPVEFDRDADVQQQIHDLAPDFIIDASGPFQAYGADPYRVVNAAIACGANYLDIADTTKFVCGIGALNASALEKNVFALSGASSCIAVSSAVLRRLTRDMSKVTSMSGGIAPSPFSGAGLSVMQAVTQSAGKPVAATRGNGTEMVYPFTESRPFTIAPPGYLPLRRRAFSIVDVPDLRLAKTVEPRVETVWFGAAPVPAIYHAILRVLARAVRRGWFTSLEYLSRPMHRVLRDLSWGEHRGGMFVEIDGETKSGQRMTRSWHLVAEGDDGPAIPAMASAVIIRNCLDGRWPSPGARPATSELELEEFDYYFKQMDIHIGDRTEAAADNWPIFRRVLDGAWAELPPEVRELHDIVGTRNFAGRASVTRGRSVLARLVGRLVGFPPSASDIPVDVTMSCIDGREHWSRNFDGDRFSSVMSAGNGRLKHLVCERFGPTSFSMALVLDNGQLNYVPRGWTFLGIPMPGSLAPQGKTCEYVEAGKFRFHVEIRLPIIGHIVTYDGWLQPGG